LITIWVDADACPRAVREILCRASIRTKIRINFVANSPIPLPKIKQINFVQVPPGFDVADNEISKRANPKDLVITSDIPLAADLIVKGVSVLNPRGENFTEETIKQKLTLRDFMETMRSSGEHTGKSKPLAKADLHKFANSLDRYITKHKKI
tara:strand:- start:508 stop:963 length:456 start_codon:yes stop_codon:yes gene_type:complete